MHDGTQRKTACNSINAHRILLVVGIAGVSQAFTHALHIMVLEDYSPPVPEKCDVTPIMRSCNVRVPWCADITHAHTHAHTRTHQCMCIFIPKEGFEGSMFLVEGPDGREAL